MGAVTGCTRRNPVRTLASLSDRLHHTSDFGTVKIISETPGGEAFSRGALAGLGDLLAAVPMTTRREITLMAIRCFFIQGSNFLNLREC